MTEGEDSWKRCPECAFNTFRVKEGESGNLFLECRGCSHHIPIEDKFDGLDG